MLVGHLAVAFIAKRVESKISLGTYSLAALCADLITFPLLIAGVEHFEVARGVATNRSVGDIPYSHSLLMDAVWAAIFAAIFSCGGVTREVLGYCLPPCSATGCWISLATDRICYWRLVSTPGLDWGFGIRCPLR